VVQTFDVYLGYTGTAASSPVTAQFEQHSPEPENIPPTSPHPVSAPPVDEPNLENVPIPVYPLPTKPFPVQPPPKIVTGFAPLLPIDKGGKKVPVRHWRQANREIRGIAGGRWVTRTWVGDKDSEYAAYVASNNSQRKATEDKASVGSVTLPKPSGVSTSAPASLKALSKLKASSKSQSGSAVTSAAPSRAPSVIPESQVVQSTSAVRAPTKMRILLAPSASSEGGDSDMAPRTDT
jgi:Wiskott-Aldrich syndrome protein